MKRTLLAWAALTGLLTGAVAAQDRAQTLSRGGFYAQTSAGTLGYAVDGIEGDTCRKDFTRVVPLEGDGWFRLPTAGRLCLVVNHIDTENEPQRLSLNISITKVFDRIDVNDPPSIDTLMFRIEGAPAGFEIPFLRRDSVGGNSPVMLSFGTGGVSALVIETSTRGDLSFRRRAGFLLN